MYRPRVPPLKTKRGTELLSQINITQGWWLFTDRLGGSGMGLPRENISRHATCYPPRSRRLGTPQSLSCCDEHRRGPMALLLCR